jgi:hypothetical protein
MSSCYSSDKCTKSAHAFWVAIVLGALRSGERGRPHPNEISRTEPH